MRRSSHDRNTARPGRAAQATGGRQPAVGRQAGGWRLHPDKPSDVVHRRQATHGDGSCWISYSTAATRDSGDQRGTSGPTPGQRASRSSDSTDFDVHKEAGQDNHDTPRTTPGVNRAPGRTDTNQGAYSPNARCSSFSYWKINSPDTGGGGTKPSFHSKSTC
ncbi:hypothetical protein WMY93_015796 [Mugilogobius chulae]|uniref:Uncharacterized protein n=1 Tax=Mugilogobius chulae TaxID=88201 RepID=A0AAW0P188_9GOBI